jgi:hypothetical protein
MCAMHVNIMFDLHIAASSPAADAQAPCREGSRAKKGCKPAAFDFPFTLLACRNGLLAMKRLLKRLNCVLQRWLRAG